MSRLIRTREQFFLATVEFSLHSDEIRREFASDVEKYSVSFSKRPSILLCSLGSRQKTLSRPTIEERVTKNTVVTLSRGNCTDYDSLNLDQRGKRNSPPEARSSNLTRSLISVASPSPSLFLYDPTNRTNLNAKVIQIIQ